MDKLLFTPGPLTTTPSVKLATTRDLGSRDDEFVTIVNKIRHSLLELAGIKKEDGYEAIIMQGSGTFGVEAVISSAIGKKDKLLNIINGAYGRRISAMAQIHGINIKELVYDEDVTPNIDEIAAVLREDTSITHICAIHLETTSGILNPIEEIASLAQQQHKIFIVDAMSSFGAIAVDLKKSMIHFLISSSNKCIQGIPGFSFILAHKEMLVKCKGQARTLSLDLYSQWEGLEKDGQFRFTPPVQSLLAFNQALLELQQEGGVTKRGQRYLQNHTLLTKGMEQLGFKCYVNEKARGYIITSFHYPTHPSFSFKQFYNLLNQRGFVIYPGKLTKLDCFRIGNIGNIQQKDIEGLLNAIKDTLKEMKLT